MPWDTALPGPEGESIHYKAFEQALSALEAEAFNFGHRFIHDAPVRAQYLARIAEMSREMTERLRRGELTAFEAAREAVDLRNGIMEATRLQSSDVGRAYAESLKRTGSTLENQCRRYARKLFSSDFTHLTPGQQNQVYRAVVEAAGRDRTGVTRNAARLGPAGKGLLVLTLAIAVYNVATADDKAKAAGKEGVLIGGGVLGGMGGGALAGLACGPGAPVCVTLGVFVGGVAGALGAEFAFDSVF